MKIVTKAVRTYGVISEEDAKASWALSGRREGYLLFDIFGGRPSTKIHDAALNSWNMQIPVGKRKELAAFKESFVNGIVVGYCQRYVAISEQPLEDVVAYCVPVEEDAEA